MKKTDSVKEDAALRHAHLSTRQIRLNRDALQFANGQIESEQIRIKATLRELARRHRHNVSRIKGLDAVIVKR